jgi:crotonobetainyl-CoA:carnitine CoA-transferase CaiB-like acyl-CoA transferase
VGSEKQFVSLCSILGCDELSNDPRFNSNQNRVLNRIVMHAELQARFKTQDREIWMTQLHAHFVPAGAIKSMDEVMENPVAKSMMLDEEIDGINTRRMATVAFTISR